MRVFSHIITTLQSTAIEVIDNIAKATLIRYLYITDFNIDSLFRGDVLLPHADMVALLSLKHDTIDVNKTDKYGYAPLHRAAQEGSTNIVKLLLQHPKIDVNKTDKYGYAPLHRAAQDGMTNIVKLLLQHPKIDVNKTNKYGETPLELAAHDNQTDIINLIINKQTHESLKKALTLCKAEDARDIISKAIFEKGMRNNDVDELKLGLEHNANKEDLLNKLSNYTESQSTEMCDQNNLVSSLFLQYVSEE